MAQEKKYDIFISYRRRGGYHFAKLLYYSLTNAGYKVSFIDHGLDLLDFRLNVRDIDLELLYRIDNSNDFIVVLDKYTFSPTLCGLSRENDWLRKELSWAIEKNKNIIPIYLDGVETIPFNQLPEDVQKIKYLNGMVIPSTGFYNVFLEKLKKKFFSVSEYKYVFLSHSHYDFDKVCRLRNLLEAEGFKPLMFFLKAFEKPEYEPMLKSILMEEIDQRDRFILCRSESSRKSEWVKFEEDYVKSQNRPYEVIDLDTDEDVQLDAIKFYRRRVSNRVFISYPRTQLPLVRGLYQKLEEEGFSPWADFKDMLANTLFIKELKGANDKTAEEGYVLYLVDCDRYGEGQRRELHYALHKSALVIPVIVAGDTLPKEFVFELGRNQWLDVRHLSEIEQIEAITQALIKHNLSLNKD